MINDTWNKNDNDKNDDNDDNNDDNYDTNKTCREDRTTAVMMNNNE